MGNCVIPSNNISRSRYAFPRTPCTSAAYLSVAMQVVRLVMTLRSPIRWFFQRLRNRKIFATVSGQWIRRFRFVIKSKMNFNMLVRRSVFLDMWQCRDLIDDFPLGLVIVQSFHELNKYANQWLFYIRRERRMAQPLTTCPSPLNMELVYCIFFLSFFSIQAVRSLIHKSLSKFAAVWVGYSCHNTPRSKDLWSWPLFLSLPWHWSLILAVWLPSSFICLGSRKMNIIWAKGFRRWPVCG